MTEQKQRDTENEDLEEQVRRATTAGQENDDTVKELLDSIRKLDKNQRDRLFQQEFAKPSRTIKRKTLVASQSGKLRDNVELLQIAHATFVQDATLFDVGFGSSSSV